VKKKEEGSSNAGDKPDRLNPLQVIGSVLAAGLGVQSSKNRERDFKQGRLGVFIAAGIVFTLLFISIVIFVVQMVLSTTAK
jgi:ABC-type Na+ efflux pump permease subunit